MEMYFENLRRSGGGDLEEVKIREEVAYITFKEAEVALRVASRSNHQVDGHTLTVTLFHPLPPKPCYHNRVLIQGLNNAITEELLRNFMESKTKAHVTEFLYGEEDGNVVVTLSDNIDIAQLGKIFQESSIEGVFLKVERVAISNCILVQNLQPSSSHDAILLYFENERRSGGGDVERVEMKTEERYCLIYFEEHSVIDRVLGKSHNMDGANCEIHLHHECLGQRTSRKRSDLYLRVSSPGNKDSSSLEDENQAKDKTSSSVSSNPEKESDFVEVQQWQENDGKNCTLPLWIKYKRAADMKIIKCIKNIPCSWNFHLYWNFYTKTEPGKQMLHEILNKYSCSVAVFTEDEDLFIFEITEKIFEHASDVVQLIHVVLDTVHKCAQQVLYLDNILVDQRIQGDVLLVVRQKKELDIARLELMGEQDKDQALVLRVVTEIIHMVKECFENHEETIHVDHNWQKVMKTFGYLQKLCEKYPSVTISDKTETAIILKGPRDQSKPAADLFLELLGTASSEVQEEIFSTGCQFEIFTYPEMCGYIDIITMELSIVWIPNHQTKKIHIFSKKSEKIKFVDKLIRSCVQERLYPLAKDQTVVSTKIFRSLEELKKMHTGKMVFNSSDKGLLLTTSDDIFKSIDDAVQEIISKETDIKVTDAIISYRKKRKVCLLDDKVVGKVGKFKASCANNCKHTMHILDNEKEHTGVTLMFGYIQYDTLIYIIDVGMGELQISRVHEAAEGDRTKPTIAKRGQFPKQPKENEIQSDTTETVKDPASSVDRSVPSSQQKTNVKEPVSPVMKEVVRSGGDTEPLKAISPEKEQHKSPEVQYSSKEQYCIIVYDVKQEDARRLEDHIKSFGMPVKFVYPCKVGEALVICRNSKEKKILLKKLKQQYKVKSVCPQKLQGLDAAVDRLIGTTVSKVKKKQDTAERKSEINISHTERINLFEAVSSQHHDIFVKDTPEIKVQKRSSENSIFGDFENAEEIENVSPTEFLALKSLEIYSKWIQQFNIKFSHDKETLYVVGDHLYVNREVKTEIEKEIAALRGKQKIELSYDPREITQFRSAVDEAKSDELLLVWDDVNKQVLVYSHNYDGIQKFKHRVEFKMGKKKLTGRSGRRFAEQVDTKPLLSEEESPTKKNIAQSFSGSQDTTNVEVFKTLEGIMVKVYKANILRLDVDCIVNAANDNLQHGASVALVIAEAAGPEIDREGSEILKIRGRINVGEHCVTTAGNLPYDCIIHTVGPRWSDYYPHDARNRARCEADLFNSIIGCFIEAENRHLKSIALPAISSGIFSVPRDMCTEQYAQAVIHYSKTRTSLVLQEIHFIDMVPDIVNDIQLAFKRHLSCDGNAKHKVNSGDQTPAFNNQAGRVHGNNQHDTTPEKDVGAASSKDRQTGEKQNLLAPVWPKFEETFVNKQKFHVYRPNQNMAVYIYTADITKLTGIEAVVCSDDIRGSGHGAVASALLQIGKSTYKSAKKKAFEKEARFGDVIVTLGGDSNFDLVIHAVVPSFKDKISPQRHRELVQICYNKILDDTNNWGKESLALPFIGTECAELGYEGSAKMFLDSLEIFCNRAATLNLKVIYIVDRDKQTTEKIVDLFRKHTDRVRINLVPTHDRSAWHQSSHTSSVRPQGRMYQ
ncbi:hypothetical protein ACJMK2_006852, partial [Sinanodonta woodiana]